MKTVVIFGSGFVGTQLNSLLTDDGMSVHVVRDRINSVTDARRALADIIDPFVIINAIGKTGKPNVDWCESHKEETFQANVEVPVHLATAAWLHPRALPLIHISSGCIFNGDDKIFREEDISNFAGSFYSHTKAEAERLLDLAYKEFSLSGGKTKPKLEIHRIRMPFVGYPDDRNLFTKLLRYNKIINVKNSITCIDDYLSFVSNRIFSWIEDAENGSGLLTSPDFGWKEVIHCFNEEPITNKRILEIFQEEDPAHDYLSTKEFINAEQLNSLTKAPRTNCILKKSKKYIARPTEEAVRDAIHSYIRLT